MLATNIAETAITIDDIVYVIDTGLLKEKSYDPRTAVATLQQCWVSRASAHQRRGRAGRCQAGICFHMYSRTRYSAFADFQEPEIKRSPLEELCLQVSRINPNPNHDTNPSQTLNVTKWMPSIARWPLGELCLLTP